MCCKENSESTWTLGAFQGNVLWQILHFYRVKVWKEQELLSVRSDPRSSYAALLSPFDDEVSGDKGI